MREAMIWYIGWLVSVSVGSAKVIPKSGRYRSSLESSIDSYDDEGASSSSSCLSGVGTSVHFKGYFGTVDCRHRRLVSLTDNLPDSTEVLLLQDNAISVLQPTDEIGPTYSIGKMHRLMQLDLSLNRIDRFPDLSSFNESISLRVIDLGLNRIDLLDGCPLSSSIQRTLEILLLESNLIRHMEMECFDRLEHLRWLSLSNNLLRSIRSKAFHPLRRLTTLNLDSNHIEEMADDAFLGLGSLQSLNLSGNRIAVLSDGSFHGLDSLEHLDLSGNLLQVVPTKSFLHFLALQFLSLDSNPILRLSRRSLHSFGVHQLTLSNLTQLRVLEEEALFNFSSLKVLRIERNPRLIHIHERSIVDTPEVTTLHLHGNALKTFSEGLVGSLRSLELLRLNGNPLRIDCDAKWIFDHVRFNNTRPQIDIDLKITEPQFSSSHPPYSSSSSFSSSISSSSALTSFPTFSSSMSSLSSTRSSSFSSSASSSVSLRLLSSAAISDYSNSSHVNSSSISPFISSSFSSFFNFFASSYKFSSLSSPAFPLPTPSISLSSSSTSPFFSSLSVSASSSSSSFSSYSFSSSVSSSTPLSYIPSSSLSSIPISSFSSSPPPHSPTPSSSLSPFRSNSVSLCPPEILPTFDPHLYVGLGVSMALDCLAIGTPLPSVHWISPTGNRIPPVRSVKLDGLPQTLVIAHVRPRDAGEYRCVAENRDGKRQTTLALHVYDPLAILTCQSIGPDHVTVTWTNLESTASGISYVITHRLLTPSGARVKGQVALRSPRMRSCRIVDLLRSSDYELCLGFIRTGSSDPVRINCTKVATDADRGVVTFVDELCDLFVLCTTAFTCIASIGLLIVMVIVYRRCSRSRCSGVTVVEDW